MLAFLDRKERERRGKTTNKASPDTAIVKILKRRDSTFDRDCRSQIKSGGEKNTSSTTQFEGVTTEIRTHDQKETNRKKIGVTVTLSSTFGVV